jgi:hypothetical protein
MLRRKRQDSFGEWLSRGMENGWVTSPFCGTHDGPPMTQIEADEWDAGYDPCAPMLRIILEGENPNDFR